MDESQDKFTVDFSSIKEQASNFIDTETPSEPASDTLVPDTSKPAAVAAAVATPAVATSPEIEELDPETHGDRLVKVKIDGKYEVRPLKDVTAGYSRTSHFTRQMQDLATQRKEVEGFKEQFEALKTEREQIQTFLRNPNLVYQFLQQGNPQMFAAAQQTPQNPDEIATVQQARDIVAQQNQQMLQRLQQMEATLNEKMVATGKDIEARRETAEYVTQINTTLKDIFVKHPILNKVRMAEDIIRYEVSKLQPKSIADALEAFRTVADGVVEDLQEGYTTTNKTKIAAAAKLTTARIEPPGGSGPTVTPTVNFKKADGQIDWNKLKQAAAEYAE